MDIYCVLQICDPDLKILNVNARYPGARHDAYIWTNCSARRVMERQYERGERKTWLIGIIITVLFSIAK